MHEVKPQRCHEGPRLALVLSALLVVSPLIETAHAQAAPTGWTISTTPNHALAAPPGMAVPAGPAGAVTSAVVALPERVGRVATFNGAAQFWDSHERQWTPLQINRFVTEGDRIRSAVDSQVEVQIGTLAVFIGPQSDVEFSRLDVQGAQLRLHQGHLVAKVRTPEWARDLQLLTGELVAQALSPGLYRVDRDTVQGGRSAAAALRGLLVLNAADSRLQVAAGQRLEVMGAAAGGVLRSTTLLNDAFAAWVSARDQAPESNGFAGVAPLREMTGLDALDRHGRWESHPEIGWVWYPLAVRPGWEPFRDGRWVWVKPWGWTWVDDTPWGFAPSNYGRWLQWNNRWVWSPGPVRSRPLPPVTPPPVAAPVLRPRDDVPPGEWRADHENRSVRTPRVDGWNPGPGRLVNPPVDITPNGAERPARPERRHGFERPTDRAVDRAVDRAPERSEPPQRVDRPDSGRPSPKPQDRERGEKPDRPRQLAQ